MLIADFISSARELNEPSLWLDYLEVIFSFFLVSNLHSKILPRCRCIGNIFSWNSA